MDCHPLPYEPRFSLTSARPAPAPHGHSLCGLSVVPGPDIVHLDMGGPGGTGVHSDAQDVCGRARAEA